MSALAGFEVRSTPVSLPLTAPLRARPVGGGSEVTLCRGSVVTVRVVRPCDGGAALFGLGFQGRAFLASPDALVAATDAAPAPAPAAAVSDADAASAARAAGAAHPEFFAPRRRAAGDAPDAPLRGRPARRRGAPAGRPSDAVRASLDAHVRRNRGLS